jgi:pilus assembly protein TadC
VTVTVALLVFLAVLSLTRSTRTPERLARVCPEAAAPRHGSGRGSTLAVCALGGLAVWALVGGVLGALVGLALSALGPPWLAKLAAQEGDDALVARDLPLALDLLAACLAGGAVPQHAVQAVAEALPGPCGARLATVAARLAVGAPAGDAWQALGSDRGPAGAAARALARAASAGAPVATSVQRVAGQARLEAVARAERAARRAGVLVVAPLGLCFLPAFLLIGVVPAVLGLAIPAISLL